MTWTNMNSIQSLAQDALEKAQALTNTISNAAHILSAAGPPPDFTSPEWTDQVATARQAVNHTLDQIDDQSQLAQPLLKLSMKLQEVYEDYMDAHRDDYYDLWHIDRHHLLIDNRSQQRILAFEYQQDAANWLRYHTKGGYIPLDPRTIPIMDPNPVRTAHVIDAVASKEWLRNRSADIREYLRRQDDQELQGVRASIPQLSPELRSRLPKASRMLDQRTANSPQEQKQGRPSF